MFKEKQLPRTSRFAVLFAVVVLALAMSIMSACTSGQASSTSANASAGSASAGSATASAASSASASANTQAQAVDDSAFIGTWDMVDMEKDGVRISDVNPGAIAEMSQVNYLNIYEDGFLDLVEGEDVFQGVWRGTSSTEGEISLTGDRVPMAIVDGTLEVGPVDGINLYFSKGESREAPPLPEGQTDIREILGY